MNGFLEEIAGVQNYGGQTTIYNRDFFDKHIDADTLISLLKVSHTYSDVIKLLEKRHEPNDNKTLQKLAHELKAINEKIVLIKNDQIELCKSKSDNSYLRKAMYQTIDVDFDKLRELATLDNKINTKLAENNARLESLLLEEKYINKEHQKINDKMMKLDTEIERYIAKLKTQFIELNGKNIDIFKEINIDSLREQYEQGLTSVIQNRSARKAYTCYLFDILKREIKNVPQIYVTAQYFVANAKKENGFDVPNLVGNNHQIMLNEGITSVAHERLRQFADVWCSGAKDDDIVLNKIGDEFLKVKSFIDGMYSYSKNLPLYNKDRSKGQEDYDKLLSYNKKVAYKADELSGRDSMRLRNVVNNFINRPSYYTSLEREPYEFALSVFDYFDQTHNEMRVGVFEKGQVTPTTEQKNETFNAQTKSTSGEEILQNPTDSRWAEEELLDVVKKAVKNSLETTMTAHDDDTISHGPMKK